MDMDFPTARDFLGDARRDFREFYLLATPEDEGLLDGLVMAHAALVVGINTPRENVAPVIRHELEKTADSVERLFTDLREAVRDCPTFQRVSGGERFAIEKMALQVRMPGSG